MAWAEKWLHGPNSYAVVSSATRTTDGELVAAPGASKKVVVLGITTNGDAAGVIEFRTDDGSGAIRHIQQLGAAGSIESGYGGAALFECDTNEALYLNLPGAGAYTVWVRYAVVSA